MQSYCGRVEQLQELVEEKDDIINRQADHIKRLTKALMGGWWMVEGERKSPKIA